jgi:multicomponent Na+:H+ antiporter subunit D
MTLDTTDVFASDAVFFPIILPVLVILLQILVDRFLGTKKIGNTISHLITILGSLGSFGVALWLYSIFEDEQMTIANESGEARVFFADGVSVFFLVVFSFIFLTACLYSVTYMMDEKNVGLYYALIFALFAGLNAIVISRDLFALFVAWELMAICGYSLVAWNKAEREPVEAGFKYLVMSSFGSLSFLFGIAIVFGLTGDVKFSSLSDTNMNSTMGHMAIIFMLLGFAVVGSAILLNQWLPDAHPAAPTPVSALLSGIVVKAGAYGILRTVTEYLRDTTEAGTVAQLANIAGTNWAQLLVVLGLLTMTEGNILVMAQFMRKDQKDIKRILAYSTTVHLGYILLGLGIASRDALVAVLYHVLNHATAKALLFMVAGWIYLRLHTRELDEMRGIGTRDPYVAVALMIGAFSLGGVPLTGGFISKFLILVSTFQTDTSWALPVLAIAVANSAVAFFGYLWLIKYLVMDKPSEKVKSAEGLTKVRLLEIPMILAICILSVAVLAFGIYPEPFLKFAFRAANLLF